MSIWRFSQDFRKTQKLLQQYKILTIILNCERKCLGWFFFLLFVFIFKFRSDAYLHAKNPQKLMLVFAGKMTGGLACLRTVVAALSSRFSIPRAGWASRALATDLLSMLATRSRQRGKTPFGLEKKPNKPNLFFFFYSCMFNSHTVGADLDLNTSEIPENTPQRSGNAVLFKAEISQQART